MNRWKSIALVAISFNVGVVYATACSDAGKATAGDGSEAEDEDGDGNDDDDDGDPDDGEGAAEAAAAIAELEIELADLKSSVLCYIGHQTDDKGWDADYYTLSGTWYEIEAAHKVYSGQTGESGWNQGPNSDSSQAYEDCF